MHVGAHAARSELTAPRLDHFTITTQGGLVLWSKAYTPTPSPVEALIRSAIIEDRASTSASGSAVSRWDKDGAVLLWTLANELDLIFIVAYPRILQLGYVEELLLETKRAFLKAYERVVRVLVGSCRGQGLEGLSDEQRKLLRGGWDKVFVGWEATFSRMLREHEDRDSKVCSVANPVVQELTPRQSKKSKSKAVVQSVESSSNSASEAVTRRCSASAFP